ncbi:hypothetical protein [Arthrobacter celericrescens]|uniref:hypothetical protein n=1 Tax=Arthrobacter celericrescens TaxID=2320851 RepID=UPI000EA11806|nr:hypothetical protein [Arthrobacter celericrescens]
MDRIEQLMKDAKPRVAEPDTTPGIDSARSIVFSTDPNVVSLAGRKPVRRTALRTAAAGLAAAAAVAAAVVVGGTLVQQPAPDPATTGTPSVSASPTPTATPSPTATQPAGLSTNGVACTPANIDLRRSTQNPVTEAIPAAEQKYYTVLGCAEGWIAYETSDEGARAMGLDGGNAWYNLARLQGNKRFLTDFQQEWAAVFTWKFHSLNNDVSQNGQAMTPQQAMDKEFAEKGIPVNLREQLVGKGPMAATPDGVPLPNGYVSPDGRVSFSYPAQWTVQPKPDAAPNAVNLTVHDASGKKVAELAFGNQGGGLGGSCTTPVPYTVLDYAEVQLPYNKEFTNSVTPRFAYRVMETGNGKVLASYGLTSTIGGADGKACLIYNVVNGPELSPIYMFASGAQMRPDLTDAEAADQGVLVFDSMAEAIEYRNTEEYRLVKAMITSLTVAERNVD